MKISRKLREEIRQAVHSQVWDYLCMLDTYDRTNAISHQTWTIVHEPACGLTENITSAVLKEIENYRK